MHQRIISISSRGLLARGVRTALVRFSSTSATTAGVGSGSEKVSFESADKQHSVWSIKDQASEKTTLAGSHAASEHLNGKEQKPPSSFLSATAAQVHVAGGRVKNENPVWATTTDNFLAGDSPVKTQTRHASSNSGSSSSSTQESTVEGHQDLYKPSTVKEEQKVPVVEINPPSASVAEGSKVWSPNEEGKVHVGTNVAAESTTFQARQSDTSVGHQSTVYSTQGEVSISNPFKTQTLQPDPSNTDATHLPPLAHASPEAAAASAFEPFAADSPLTDSVPTSFAPKISSTDTYSSATSPTGQFVDSVPASSSPLTSTSSSASTTAHQKADTSRVFGGQDTSTKGTSDGLNIATSARQANK